MALAEAILVCLTERPMTGYELAKVFDTTIGFFWRAGHQQIYRELQGLRREGLVDCEEVVQVSRPNKTVYTISRAGLDRIRQWSKLPTGRPPTRDDMLVKLYALDCVDLDALKAEIAERLDKHKSRLSLYERIFAKRFKGKKQGLRETGWLLGLRFGLLAEQANIAWCEGALKTLDRLPSGASQMASNGPYPTVIALAAQERDADTASLRAAPRRRGRARS